METKPFHAITIRFSALTGDTYEQTLFDPDLAKLVKTMTKYALILSLESFDVYGSMVESIDKYWERTSQPTEEVLDVYTVH